MNRGFLKPVTEWSVPPTADYAFMCMNETIAGSGCMLTEVSAREVLSGSLVVAGRACTKAIAQTAPEASSYECSPAFITRTLRWISGLEYHWDPDMNDIGRGDVPLVCDATSTSACRTLPRSPKSQMRWRADKPPAPPRYDPPPPLHIPTHAHSSRPAHQLTQHSMRRLLARAMRFSLRDTPP